MTISTALAGFKTSLDLLKNAIAARDDLKLAEARSTLLDRVIDIQNECLGLQEKQQMLIDAKQALTERVAQLEQEIEKARSSAADIADNYEKWTSMSGATVYRSKPGVGANGSTEYLCADCATEGKKTFLKPTIVGRVFNCPAGHGHIKL